MGVPSGLLGFALDQSMLCDIKDSVFHYVRYRGEIAHGGVDTVRLAAAPLQARPEDPGAVQEV